MTNVVRFTLTTCVWDWHASNNKLPGTPRGSRKTPNAERSPTCRSHAITLPRPCQEPAGALRGRFQKGISVAWQGNGMVCVNNTRPRCVNQMGKKQSKPLAELHGRGTAWEMSWEWHGMCESAFNVRSHCVTQGRETQHGKHCVTQCERTARSEQWLNLSQTYNCAALPHLSTRADILKRVNHRNLGCSALCGLRCLRLNVRSA
jgi:hypothetical protein